MICRQVGLRVQRQDFVKRPRRRTLFDKPVTAIDGNGPSGTCWNDAARARPIAEEHADPEHALDAHGRDFHELSRLASHW